MDISAQPVVLSFGAINGGIRYNIIPDSVELVGTIRTFDEDMRADVFKRLTSIAEHVAAANGATVQTQIPAEDGNPVTFNDEALTARMRPSLQAASGTEPVVDMPLIMGAEDFSLYAREVPGLFFFVGATPVGQDPGAAPSNHSPKFDVDEAAALALGTYAFLGERDWFEDNAHNVAAFAMFGFIFLNVCLNAVQRNLVRGDGPLRPNRYWLVAVVMLADAVVHAVLWKQEWDYWVLTAEFSLIGLFALFWALQTGERWADGVSPVPAPRRAAPPPPPEAMTTREPVGQA